jgi:hypothetical protein
MLKAEQWQDSVRSIEGQAKRLDLLATQTESGVKTTYAQFKRISDAIAQSGGSIDQALGSEVARSFFEELPKVRVVS